MILLCALSFPHAFSGNPENNVTESKITILYTVSREKNRTLYTGVTNRAEEMLLL